MTALNQEVVELWVFGQMPRVVREWEEEMRPDVHELVGFAAGLACAGELMGWTSSKAREAAFEDVVRGLRGGA